MRILCQICMHIQMKEQRARRVRRVRVSEKQTHTHTYIERVLI